MPSLESYRRRKAEVERLTYELGIAEGNINYTIRYVEDLERALKHTNLRLQQTEIMLRAYQRYVVEAYAVTLPSPIIITKPTIEIPACIKPKDVNTYIFRNDQKENIDDTTASLSGGTD